MIALAPLLAVLAGASPARAAAPWDGPAFEAPPAEVARAAAQLKTPADQGFDLLLEDGRFAFDAAGRLTSTYRTVYRILARSSVERSAQVSRYWHPWREEPPVIRARVVHADGSAQELDPATLSDGALHQEPSTYSDAKVRHAPLPGVRVGDVIEVESVLRERTPYFEGGTVARFWFGNTMPTRHVRLHIEAPATLPLKYLLRGGFAQKPRERQAGGLHTLEWDVADLPGAEAASVAAPPDQVEPHVAFSTGRSWQEVAARYAAVIDGRLLGSGLEAQAREVAAGERDRVVAAQRLLDWIAGRVRYTGLELSEAAIIPARPDDVLRRGYGDCKELSTLLVGMLRAVGQPAEVALVRTRRDDVTDLPGLDEFDHAIVHVPGDPELWIDPTAPEQPVGHLPFPVQGRLALPASPSAAGLVRTPEDRPEDNGADYQTELVLAENGAARATRTIDYRGAQASVERAMLRQTSPEEVARNDAEAIRALAADGVLVTIAREGVDAPPQPVRLRYVLEGTRWGWTEQDGADGACGPGSLFGFLPERLHSAPAAAQGAAGSGPDDGKPHDMLAAQTFAGTARWLVVPPLGFQVGSVPEPLTFEIGPLRYARSVERRDDGSVAVVHRVVLSSRRVSGADVEKIRAAVLRITKEDAHVRFDRTSTVLFKAGKRREAVELLRKLTTLHPREARHQAHLALALLDLGLGDAARRAAATAVEREPRSGYAYRVLAITLASDPLGRWLTPGCDIAGAVAAQRRAVELEPGPAARSQLALYLEAGAACVPFGPGAHVDEALALRQGVRTRDGDRTHDNALLETELATGHFAEAVALAREGLGPDAGAPALRTRRAALFLALGARDGARAARAELESARTDERAAVLQEAFRLLLRTRSYAAMPAYLEAVPGTRTAEGERTLASVRRVEAATAEASDPRSMLPRMMQAIYVSADRRAAFEELLADELRASGRGLELTRLAGTSLFDPRSADNPLSPAALVELGLSAAQCATSGDEEAVFRVDCKFPNTAGRVLVYVVRQRGAARLVASDVYPGGLGLRALRLLSDGKAAAARRVLAMAEQDFPGDPAPGAAVRVLLAKGEGPAELALAAAALACYSELAGPSLDRVAHALKASHELGTRRVLTRALAAGLELGERWEQLYALAGEAAGPEQPDSAFSAQARALEHLGRTTALRALAEERLKRHPRDPLAQRALATAASLAGEHAEALRLTRSALPERAAAADYERAAWMGLLVEPPDGTALDHARRAVSLDGKKRGSPGRILAALLAASGEPGTAVKELVEGESVYTPPEDPADWLTMGKAAETYGLVEEARALYRRAAMASGGDRLVKTLAERWGARLPP